MINYWDNGLCIKFNNRSNNNNNTFIAKVKLRDFMPRIGTSTCMYHVHTWGYYVLGFYRSFFFSLKSVWDNKLNFDFVLQTRHIKSNIHTVCRSHKVLQGYSNDPCLFTIFSYKWTQMLNTCFVFRVGVAETTANICILQNTSRLRWKIMAVSYSNSSNSSSLLFSNKLLHPWRSRC